MAGDRQVMFAWSPMWQISSTRLLWTQFEFRPNPYRAIGLKIKSIFHQDGRKCLEWSKPLYNKSTARASDDRLRSDTIHHDWSTIHDCKPNVRGLLRQTTQFWLLTKEVDNGATTRISCKPCRNQYRFIVALSLDNREEQISGSTTTRSYSDYSLVNFSTQDHRKYL